MLYNKSLDMKNSLIVPISPQKYLNNIQLQIQSVIIKHKYTKNLFNIYRQKEKKSQSTI